MQVIEGYITQLDVSTDVISLTLGSSLPAQQFIALINGERFIGIFTVIKVIRGDYVKAVVSLQADGNYRVHALLNFKNKIIHLPFWYGATVQQYINDCWRLFAYGAMGSLLFLAISFSIAHYIEHQALSMQPIETALIFVFIGLCFVLPIFLLAFLLGYAPNKRHTAQTNEICELLKLPQQRSLAIFRRKYYREGRNVYWGVFDCQDIFPDDLDEIVKRSDLSNYHSKKFHKS